MAMLRSIFEGLCFYQGYLEVLWLAILSILPVFVTLGSFVLTLWILRLYTYEMSPFKWLSWFFVTMRGILKLIMAKMTSSLNKIWSRKGLPGVLWRTLFSIFSTNALLTLFTKTFERLGVNTEEQWPCGWPLQEIRRMLLCTTFLDLTMMKFLLGCGMYITIYGIITSGIAMVPSSFE